MTEIGKHVVIEGGDGSGKSTQARRLVDRLVAEGIHASMFNEPGSSHPEAAIRHLMLDPSVDFEPATRLFLVNAARVETVRKISDSRALGRWAVSDRSWLSSVAYQAYGDQLDVEMVRNVCSYATGELWQPDLTIVLDIDVLNARERSHAREKLVDTFERREAEWHERVRTGYLEEAGRIGAVVLDASASVEEVAEQVWDTVIPLLDR